jgi:hypothetical protein
MLVNYIIFASESDSRERSATETTIPAMETQNVRLAAVATYLFDSKTKVLNSAQFRRF